nr:hypothetical protein CFP56_02289 [Quercus suber]
MGTLPPMLMAVLLDFAYKSAFINLLLRTSSLASFINLLPMKASIPSASHVSGFSEGRRTGCFWALAASLQEKNRILRKGFDGSLEFHISPDGQEQGGRLPASDGPDLTLHPQPMVAVHSGLLIVVAFGPNDLQHLKHSLGVRPLRSITQLDGERVSCLGDMSAEVSHRGIHKSFDPRHSSSTEAHPNNNGNNEFHAQDTNQTNAVEFVGAFHHFDAGNLCSQGGPTAGRMELDDFQEGICPRM